MAAPEDHMTSIRRAVEVDRRVIMDASMRDHDAWMHKNSVKGMVTPRNTPMKEVP